MKLKSFLCICLLVSLVYSSLSSFTYYVTEEQLTELEKQSAEQKNQIQQLNNQLITLDIRCQTLEKQLETSDSQLENCQKALKEAQTSSRKSEIKNLMTNIGIGTGCFVLGIVFTSIVKGVSK